MQFKVVSARVGFGITIMPTSQNPNVLKYNFEPEISLEVPATCSDEDAQETLNRLCDDLVTIVQKSVKNKIKIDRERVEKEKLERANESTR
jgi:hypothetical protein